MAAPVRRKRRPSLATPPVAARPSRGQLRDAELRAALAPLGEGERPITLWVSIVVAVLIAIGVSLGVLLDSDLHHRGGSTIGGAFLTLIFLALAIGMYHRRYWAVLGFEALVGFQVLASSLALLVAATLEAAVVGVVSIVLGGWLFWKLVRVMGRIQAGRVRR